MKQEPPIVVRKEIELPPWLDRLAARVARWPWWLILIAAGLLAVFYSILTSDFYRRALVFVTDNPRLTTDQYANVVYDVRGPDGEITRVRGVITGHDGERALVTTQPEVLTIVPHDDIADVICQSPGPDGRCPPGEPVTVARRSITGRLLFEDLGKFQIATDYGPIVEIRKINADLPATEREPEGCSANQEGRCRIRLALKPEDPVNRLQGILIEDSSTQVVVQVEPPRVTAIHPDDIVNVVVHEPAQCALNNLAACNEGIFLTLGVAVSSFALAVALGLIFGLMRISRSVVWFNISTVYVEAVRGVPLLVILLFTNFAFAPWFRDEFPKIVPALWQIIVFLGSLFVAHYLVTRWSWRRFEPGGLYRPITTTLVVAALLIVFTGYLGARSDLAPVQRGVLGLAFGYGAYLAELFRAGIQSIGRGQMEAARSLGMTYFQAMRYVILPQAFRVILPPLGNEFIAILKDTSLITILALPELTQKARLFAADTLRPFEPYITIGVLYLCMTLFLSFLVRVAERRTARQD